MGAKKIGLYGGSFDPVHWGHINLAIEMKEKRNLDEVWFCPAKINPHKEHRLPSATSHHRLRMLQLALEGIPGFRLLDLEIQREGPSYTIDTLKTLVTQEPFHQFSLIIGEDTLPGFHLWRHAEEIVSLVPILVGSRRSQTLPEDLVSLQYRKYFKEGWTPIRRMEITATELRQRLTQRLYCAHLMPQSCLDYIYNYQLYI